jgi:restriction endonuclease Mrr
VNLQFFEPSFRFYDRIPKERLVEILSNLSTTELLKILEKMVPQEDLLPMLAASLEPAEVIETAVERPVEKETKERKSGIAEKYRQAIVEKDSNRKGKLLEEVMKGIISLVRGLEVVGSNVNDGTKEIDIQVRNRNEENVWETIFDPMVFIECKNWSESVKSKDIRDFEGKLVSGDLNAGILVAVNGISGDGEGAWGVVREALQRGRKIVVLDGVALDEILKCRGVSEVIDKQYIQLYQIGAH